MCAYLYEAAVTKYESKPDFFFATKSEDSYSVICFFYTGSVSDVDFPISKLCCVESVRNEAVVQIPGFLWTWGLVIQGLLFPLL